MGSGKMDMEPIIERHLLKKLKEAVDGKEHKEFQDFSAFIDQTLQSYTKEDGVGRGKLYELHDLLTESQTSSMKNHLPCFGIGKTLRRIMDDISSGNGEHSPSSSEKEEFFRWSSRLAPPKFYGFKDQLMLLTSSLVRDDYGIGFQAMGVVGKAGVGKTTLCQKFFNEESVINHFCPRIWVCMCKEPFEEGDMKTAIVRRILVNLGIEDVKIKGTPSSEEELTELLVLLHRQLWGKKYLIVFDDTRDTDEWYTKLDSSPTDVKNWVSKLAYGLPKGYGGTVIVTSRNVEIAQNMVGQQNLYRMMPDMESCWEIFKETAGIIEGNLAEGEKEELMEEVKKKSAGVPLAAQIMGQIYKEQVAKVTQSVNQDGHQSIPQRSNSA